MSMRKREAFRVHALDAAIKTIFTMAAQSGERPDPSTGALVNPSLVVAAAQMYEHYLVTGKALPDPRTVVFGTNDFEPKRRRRGWLRLV